MTAANKVIIRQLVVSLLLICVAATITACGPKVIKSTPFKKRVTVPPIQEQKKVQVVPSTQMPYRINGKTYYPIPSSDGYSEKGTASWYGSKFHGRKTSSGETYNMYDWTAAHKTLPMGTYLLVKNLDNGREVTVRVNDRGPFSKNRIVDLSYNAARKLWMIKRGTARVQITALGEAVKYKQANKTTKRFLPHKDFQSGNFYVQIGSFENRTNADRLKKKMIKWGKKTVIQKYEMNEKPIFRVQVQAGKTLTDAMRMERVLAEAGYPEGFVVAH